MTFSSSSSTPIVPTKFFIGLCIFIGLVILFVFQVITNQQQQQQQQITSASASIDEQASAKLKRYFDENSKTNKQRKFGRNNDPRGAFNRNMNIVNNNNNNNAPPPGSHYFVPPQSSPIRIRQENSQERRSNNNLSSKDEASEVGGDEDLDPPYKGNIEIPRSCGARLVRNQESPTPCPDEELYLALWLLLRKKSHWTVVDVGSNKGYSVAAMLEAFNVSSSPSSPSLFSRKALGLDIFQYGRTAGVPPVAAHALCGACCDCTAENLWTSTTLSKHPWAVGRDRDVSVRGVDFYMFDGMKSHVDYVNRFFPQQLKKFYQQQHENKKQNISLSPPKISFHAYHKAVSHSKGKTKFCDSHFGAENAHIGDCSSKSAVAVDVVTLDEFLPPSVTFIDVLLTDTEGFDFDVLAGARERFLKLGNVGIYIFEIHRGPNKRGVHSVVSELESYGFQCYYPVHGSKLARHVVRISGECWQQDYEKKRGWFNIVCANERRFPELTRVFVELENLPKDRTWATCDFVEVKTKFLEKYRVDRDFDWINGNGTP